MLDSETPLPKHINDGISPPALSSSSHSLSFPSVPVRVQCSPATLSTETLNIPIHIGLRNQPVLRATPDIVALVKSVE